MSEKPSTESYKGVRDFYPEDMAVQRYIFDTWAKVAESFGFERYDASILEPSELYRAKSSEEIVNDQTYTFIDRGEREVTLRPEMTPTVARMVAGRRRELTFPLRWYSIPNLFRYERAQRGRLREHWQLNADIFGTQNQNADVEIILLASEILKAFGAKESDFEIHINDRKTLFAEIDLKLKDAGRQAEALQLLDSKSKMSAADYTSKETELFSTPLSFDITTNETMAAKMVALQKLGVNNVTYDESIVRGFTYYTGTIFEIFDTSPDNRRSLLGGGRYDNLAGLFDGDPIPAVGFGMGDVTMRDFLETHDLLKNMPVTYKTAPTVMFVTDDSSYIPVAESYAQALRAHGIRAGVNLGDKSIGEQRKKAAEAGALYTINIDSGSTAGTLTAKHLAGGTDITGSIADIGAALSN